MQANKSISVSGCREGAMWGTYWGTYWRGWRMENSLQGARAGLLRGCWLGFSSQITFYLISLRKGTPPIRASQVPGARATLMAMLLPPINPPDQPTRRR